MPKTESIGLLEQNGDLWLIRFTQGHAISVGLEDFDGKLVKVTREPDKITIEALKEPEPSTEQARTLCMAVS